MKFLKSKTLALSTVITCSLVLLIVLLSPLAYSAGRGGAGTAQTVQDEEFETVTREGPFEELNLKKKLISIDDRLYKLDPDLKVIGTRYKPGFITDLRKGEWVKATSRRASSPSEVPYVILIERQ